MKIQIAIQILVLFTASLASALPVVNLNKVMQDFDPANCQRTSQTQNFKDLIVKASVIGDDNRKVLSKNLKEVGFTAAEQEQAIPCTGNTYCPGGNGGKASMQSAGAICPIGGRSSGGHCAADRLATAGHMFTDKVTNRFISQLKDCDFRNYRGHISKLEIKDLNIIDPKNEATNPHKNMRADKMVIRLLKPIPGCNPYDLHEDFEAPPEGTKVVALTHIQEDQAGKLDGSEPLAYACEITRTFSARGGGPALFYSDCDVNGTGSGGFTMVRDFRDKLTVAGMFIRSGTLSQNGKPYSESEKNYTLSVGTHADFVQLAAQPGKRPDPQLSQGQMPTLRPTSGN